MNRGFRGSVSFLCLSPRVSNVLGNPGFIKLIGAVVFSLLAGAAIDAEAQTCSSSPAPHQISLFANDNYSGPCVTLGIGNYPNPSSIGINNDTISSLKLGSDVRAVLCEHDNFTGRCMLFQRNVDRLSAQLLEDNSASSAWVFRTPSYSLPANIYIGRANGDQTIVGDRDKDGLRDDYENLLAEQFKPVVKLDAGEGARRTNPVEPIVLFQVRPHDCAGRGCNRPTVVIRWAFLFLRDGGYPTDEPGSPMCNNHTGIGHDRHAGDNDRAAFVLGSGDKGRTWELEEVHVGNLSDPQKLTGKFVWPNNMGQLVLDGLTKAPLERRRRPFIHMSNGKHHMYLQKGDQPNSPYSSVNCADDVDGDGARVDPNLSSAVLPGKSDVPLTMRRNNVGEPEVAGQLPTFFVNDLSHLFPLAGCPQGRSAWSSEEFCSNKTFKMYDMWQALSLIFKP